MDLPITKKRTLSKQMMMIIIIITITTITVHNLICLRTQYAFFYLHICLTKNSGTQGGPIFCIQPQITGHYQIIAVFFGYVCFHGKTIEQTSKTSNWVRRRLTIGKIRRRHIWVRRNNGMVDGWPMSAIEVRITLTFFQLYHDDDDDDDGAKMGQVEREAHA